MTITPELVERVEAMLSKGRSQLTIARRLNVPWSTVYRIASGTWQATTDEEDKKRRRATHARRCSGCGLLLYVRPCLHCQIEAASDTPRRPAA